MGVYVGESTSNFYAVKQGYAEAMIGGAVYTSGDFIAVSTAIIGLQKGISVHNDIVGRFWGSAGSDKTVEL